MIRNSASARNCLASQVLYKGQQQAFLCHNRALLFHTYRRESMLPLRTARFSSRRKNVSRERRQSIACFSRQSDTLEAEQGKVGAFLLMAVEKLAGNHRRCPPTPLSRRKGGGKGIRDGHNCANRTAKSLP